MFNKTEDLGKKKKENLIGPLVSAALRSLRGGNGPSATMNATCGTGGSENIKRENSFIKDDLNLMRLLYTFKLWWKGIIDDTLLNVNNFRNTKRNYIQIE